MKNQRRKNSFPSRLINGLILILVMAGVLCCCAVFAGESAITDLDRARTHIIRGENDQARELIEKHQKADPTDPASYFLLASMAEKSENLQLARQNMEKALQLAPENLQYKEKLADLLYRLREYPEALPFFVDSAEKRPDDTDLQLKLARIYQNLGQFEKGLAITARVTGLWPGNSEGHIVQGDLLLASGRADQAVISYKNAVRLGYEDKAFFYRLAEIQDDNGDIAGATETLRKLLTIYPGERQAFRLLSRLYRKNGDTLSSVDAWFSYVAGGLPVSSTLGFMLGFTLFFLLFFRVFKFINSIFLLPVILISGALGNVKTLRFLSGIAKIYGTDYLVFICNQEIIMLDPDDAEARRQIGSYYESRDNLPLARKYLEEAVRLDPDMGDAWFSLGAVLLQQKEYKKGELALKKALQAGEENFLTWYHLGLAYYKQDMFSEGAGAAKEALEMSVEFTPSFDVFVESCESSGQIEMCRTTLERLLDKNPGNVKILLEIGNLLMTGGRAAESLQYFQQALDLAPYSYEVWYYYGVAQREAGQVENALSSIKRSIDLDSKSSWVHTSYGLTHIMGSKNREAVRILRKSLELDPMSSYSHYLLGVLLNEKEPGKAKDHIETALKSFARELETLSKPWQKANEYQCIALAHQMKGDRKKAVEALQQAVKYARITPGEIWIFSERKMKLTPPVEFIDEIQSHIKKIEPEEAVEPAPDRQIS